MQSLPSNPHILSPLPFGQNGDKSTIPNASSQTEMNWNDGFPQIFSKLISDGGKYLKREDMNAILYALSKELLYNLWGGTVMFSQDVCNAISGYPLYAKLTYKDPSGDLRFIESQIPNNTIIPSEQTIDVPTDSTGNYDASGTVKWKTVIRSTPEFSLFPDWSNMTIICTQDNMDACSPKIPFDLFGATGQANWKKDITAESSGLLVIDTRDAEHSTTAYGIFAYSQSAVNNLGNQISVGHSSAGDDSLPSVFIPVRKGDRFMLLISSNARHYSLRVRFFPNRFH